MEPEIQDNFERIREIKEYTVVGNKLYGGFLFETVSFLTLTGPNTKTYVKTVVKLF